MSLAPGARLGTYEVLAAIGAGGMGEVYRARDTKLGRDVALKILPETFATDPERLGRFRREAQVLAALNHVNIAAIYGFEDQGAAHALVLELVDGPTLAERIAEGPMPFAQALVIVRQVAAALEAAHEQGIIHRDLKPANIKLRDDGTVKVLDFGLAKALATDGDPSASSVSNSPTLTARATQLGTILGTAAYMAPEQAKGRAVDRRADIWAFGVVLYELLTGQRAFDGDDVSDVLASVLKSDPDWSALPAAVPAPARRLLRRCLEKDPKRRLRDIGEGLIQLDDAIAAGDVSSSIAGASVPARAMGHSWWRRALPIAVTAMVAALVTLLVYRRFAPAPSPSPPVRFQHLPPASDGLYISAQGTDVAVSNDGQTIAFTSLPTGSSAPHIRIHRLTDLDSTVLAGTERGFGPFFSPDGQWVGFLGDSSALRIDKVSVAGGARALVTETKQPIAGATWMSDGSIVIGMRAGGLRRVPPGATDSVEIAALDPAIKETAHRWPAAIPGTSLVLFSYDLGGGATSSATLAVLDVTSGRITRLKVLATSARYVSGHLVFTGTDGTLRAQPFDLARLEPSGVASVIAEGVRVKGSGAANFDLGPAATLVYTGGTGFETERTLTWVERGGKETPIGAPPRNYYYARVSPTGGRLALDIRDQEQDVWIWEPRGTLMRLTADAESDQYGLWTPDGQRLVFQSSRSPKRGIYIVRADGSSAPELLAESDGYPNAVTPDGKGVIIRAGVGKNDLLLVSIAGDHTLKPLLATEHDELNATLSPDGRWMAYQSDLSGQEEIWVRPFPNVNDSQTLISTKGGTEPVWSPDGREIFYLAGDNKLMSVPVSPVGALSPGTPTLVFDAMPYYFGGVGRNYDIAPDGRKFVMVKNPLRSKVASEPIFVTLNWTMPPKK